MPLLATLLPDSRKTHKKYLNRFFIYVNTKAFFSGLLMMHLRPKYGMQNTLKRPLELRQGSSYLCAKKHFFGHFFVPFGHFWSFLVRKTVLLCFLSVKSVSNKQPANSLSPRCPLWPTIKSFSCLSVFVAKNRVICAICV